jgi:hypothetical protein
MGLALCRARPARAGGEVVVGRLPSGWHYSHVSVSLAGASGLVSSADGITELIVSIGTIVVFSAAIWRKWLGPRLKKRRRRQLDSGIRETAAAELNSVFAGAAEIKGFPQSEPRLSAASDDLAIVLDEPIRRKARAIRPRLEKAGRNELHAVMAGDATWRGDPFVWTYQTIDYATISALREANIRFPPIITANVLVCCAEKGLVYLLRRSEDVDTYPNSWHIMGGNYTAEGVHRLHDREDLAHTASRELSEEMGIHVAIPKGIERVATMELSDDGTRDFVQLTYLGLNLEATLAERIRHSEEGGVSAMTLSGLADALLTSGDSWVPTGRMQVLLWLALGAPTTGAEASFDRADARRIYERWRAAHPAGQPVSGGAPEA